MTRPTSAPYRRASVGSIWTPAFAGEFGFLEVCSRLLATRCGLRKTCRGPHSQEKLVRSLQPDGS
ncbi:hypothetical protein CA607_20395 [Caulobacter vibrioides]|nr:hypothetical protein CA607_20395 [Caulobacter vibrioides]